MADIFIGWQFMTNIAVNEVGVLSHNYKLKKLENFYLLRRQELQLELNKLIH